MNKSTDLEKLLKTTSLNDDDINHLLKKIDGTDVDDLINALTTDVPEKKYERLFSIMKKYGFKISESCILEGFSIKVSLSKEKDVNDLKKWLNDQEIKYTSNNVGQFHIECDTREKSYLVSKKVLTIPSKSTFIRDQLSEKENQDMKKARDENPQPKVDYLERGKSNKYTMKVVNDKRKKPDRYKPHYNEAYTRGDEVMVGDKRGKVQIIDGPDETIGILINGELEMFPISEVNKINEQIYSTTLYHSVDRFKKLAGIKN